MASDYLENVKKQLTYYKSVGEKTFVQLSDDQLFWQYNEESNSIAVIVKHLWGNMLSRFTDFMTSDGEKEWRDREAEFENDIKSRAELLAKWEAGWDCVFQAIHPLEEADLDKEIFIRNMGHSVVEALNRQMAHYAYHIGQIVFLGKMLCGKNWVSMTIPRGGSKAFNAEKFAKPRHKENFADKFLEEE